MSVCQDGGVFAGHSLGLLVLDRALSRGCSYNHSRVMDAVRGTFLRPWTCTRWRPGALASPISLSMNVASDTQPPRGDASDCRECWTAHRVRAGSIGAESAYAIHRNLDANATLTRTPRACTPGPRAPRKLESWTINDGGARVGASTGRRRSTVDTSLFRRELTESDDFLVTVELLTSPSDGVESYVDFFQAHTERYEHRPGAHAGTGDVRHAGSRRLRGGRHLLRHCRRTHRGGPRSEARAPNDDGIRPISNDADLAGHGRSLGCPTART